MHLLISSCHHGVINKHNCQLSYYICQFSIKSSNKMARQRTLYVDVLEKCQQVKILEQGMSGILFSFFAAIESNVSW